MLVRYKRRELTEVSAVQLALNTEGFTYLKWGSEQRCRAGDWVVDNRGEVYTVNAVSFARTYRCVGLGRYIKHSAVWAEEASADGRIATKEGLTQYCQGDFIVYNGPDRSDGYAITAERFHSLYELDAETGS